MNGFLLDALGRWIRDLPLPVPPADISPALLLDDLERHHLESFFHACTEPANAVFPPETLESFRNAHRELQIRLMRHHAAAATIAQALETEGIPCIGLRGPFADTELYRDQGIRFFTDLDLLVPRRNATQSLRILQELGYRFIAPALPEWFYRRHHLHWPLIHSRTHLACDLHWAIDHPYSLLKVDYATIFERSFLTTIGQHSWRCPDPIHAVLIQAIHLSKECAAIESSESVKESPTAILDCSMVFKWIDFGRMLKLYEPHLDWPELYERARVWKASEHLSQALRRCDAIFPGLVPAAAAGLSAAGPGSKRCRFTSNARWPGALSRHGGFRSSRINELVRFLWPEGDYFDQRGAGATVIARIGHALWAAPRLMLAGIDALACGALLLVRTIARWKTRC